MSGRPYAADSFDTIRERIAQINEEEAERCPVHGGRLLFDCLRSSSRCVEECPLKSDWLGPQG